MAQFYYLLIDRLSHVVNFDCDYLLNKSRVHPIVIYISESTQKIGAWVFIHFVLHLFCTLLLYLIYVHYNQRDFDLIRIRITNERD